MNKIQLVFALLMHFGALNAQTVLGLLERDVKEELADFYLEDALTLGEITFEKRDSQDMVRYYYIGRTDSSRYKHQSGEYTFWRNQIILAQGKLNPDEYGPHESNGARTGAWTFNHHNGMLRANGSYDHFGNKTGKWLYYYPNNQLEKVENYVIFDTLITWDADSGKVWRVHKSKLDEEYLEYYDNGQIKVKGYYQSAIVLRDSAYLVDYQAFCDVPDDSMLRYVKGSIIETRKSSKWLYYDDKGAVLREEDFD